MPGRKAPKVLLASTFKESTAKEFSNSSRGRGRGHKVTGAIANAIRVKSIGMGMKRNIGNQRVDNRWYLHHK